MSRRTQISQFPVESPVKETAKISLEYAIDCWRKTYCGVFHLLYLVLWDSLRSGLYGLLFASGVIMVHQGCRFTHWMTKARATLGSIPRSMAPRSITCSAILVVTASITADLSRSWRTFSCSVSGAPHCSQKFCACKKGEAGSPYTRFFSPHRGHTTAGASVIFPSTAADHLLGRQYQSQPQTQFLRATYHQFLTGGRERGL